MAIKFYTGTLLCCLLYLGSWQVVLAEGFSDIKNLINNKQYSKAWQQLQQSKYNNEGDASFDYLYGVVAFEMGNYIQAIFALDRVTVINPNDVNARIYLTRTYRKLDNNQAVSQQLGELRKLEKVSNFTCDTKQQIKGLGGNSKQALKATFNTRAVVSVGYSDNVNFGTDDSSIDSPKFGLIELRPSALRKKASFSQVRIHVDVQKPLSSNYTWFSSARLSNKKYTTDSESDVAIAKLQTGILTNRGKQQYSTKLYTQPVYLDKNYYSNTTGVGVGVAYQVNKKQRVDTALSHEKYTDKKRAELNKKRTSLLATYTLNQKKTQHQASVFLAGEASEADSEDQYARNLAKVSYRSSRQWNPKNLSFASMSHQVANYAGVNAVYGQKRKDYRNSLNVGHEYRVSKKATAFVNAEYVDNKSNLSLYNTDRNQITAGVAFQF